MKIRIAYVISGIVTGLIILIQFIAAIPDGRLIISVCDVGQGDAVYVRFPDGRDMLVDGGPGDRVLTCLGSAMPLYDRTIDLVVLTHPDGDHLTGLVSVLSRYRVGTIVRSDVGTDGDTYAQFTRLVAGKHIPEKFVTAGDAIDIGAVRLRVLWPSRAQVAAMREQPGSQASVILAAGPGPAGTVLGAAAKTTEHNAGSVVIHLSYGKFDAVLTGDADARVQPMMVMPKPNDGIVEVFKVPHHGSKTGIAPDFLTALSSKGVRGSLAVISVGRNSYGHPAPEIVTELTDAGFAVDRTDLQGKITITTDGVSYTVKGEKTPAP
jgi:competence protein ComEC